MEKNLLSDFMNLIYPKTCITCGEQLLKKEKHLCLHCQSDLPRTNYHLMPDNPLEVRCWGKFLFQRGTAFFHYAKGSPYQKILQELKYNDQPEIGKYFGELAARDLLSSPDFKNFDLIIPVPLHPDKQIARGYNQSEQIAMGLSAILQIEVDTVHLIRQKENETQTKRNIYERYKNTMGLFSTCKGEELEDLHILLVDDVLTTGSTMESCASELNKIKGLKLSLFALAFA